MQEMEEDCFAASASKAVYLGRLASAVRTAAQTSCVRSKTPGKATLLSQSPSDGPVSRESADSIGRDTESGDASGMTGPDLLGKAVKRLEELQPFEGSKIIKALDWLQKLKGLAVTAEMLKANALGRRLRTISKSKHPDVASQANAVVAGWKAQLLNA